MSEYLYLKTRNKDKVRNYQSPYINLSRNKSNNKSEITIRIENLKKKFTKTHNSFSKSNLKTYLPRHSFRVNRKKGYIKFEDLDVKKKNVGAGMKKFIEDDEISNKTFKSKYVNKKNENRKVRHLRNFSYSDPKNFYLSNKINRIDKKKKSESKEDTDFQKRYSFKKNMIFDNPKIKKKDDSKKNFTKSKTKLLNKYSHNEILIKNEKLLQKENNMLKREIFFKDNENANIKVELTISENNIKELKKKNEILKKKTFDLETQIEDLNYDKENYIKINEELEFRNNDLLKKYYNDLRNTTSFNKEEIFYDLQKDNSRAKIFELLKKEVKNEKIKDKFETLFSNFEKEKNVLEDRNKNYINEMKNKIDEVYNIIIESFQLNNSLSIQEIDQNVKIIKENLELILKKNNYNLVNNKNSEIKMNEELFKIVNFLELDDFKIIEDKLEYQNLFIIDKIYKKLLTDKKSYLHNKEKNNITLKTEQYSLKNLENTEMIFDSKKKNEIKNIKSKKELEEEIKILKEQIEDYNSYLNKYKESIDIKNNEIKKLKIKINELNVKLEEIEINNEDIDIMNQKIEELTQNEINLKKKILLIKKKIYEKDKVLESKLKIINDFRSGIKKKEIGIDKLQKKNIKLKEELESFKLQKQDLITSLKKSEDLEMKNKILQEEKDKLVEQLRKSIDLNKEKNKRKNKISNSQDFEEFDELHHTQSVIIDKNQVEEEYYKSNSVNLDIIDIEEKNDSVYDKSKIREYIGEEIEIFIKKILKTHAEEKTNFENKILILEKEKGILKKKIQDINIKQQKIIITNLQWDKLKKDNKTLKLIINEKNEEIENLNLKIKMLENKFDTNKEEYAEYEDEEEYSEDEDENENNESDNNLNNEIEEDINNKNLDFENKLNSLKILIENTKFENDEKRNKIVLELEKYDILNCQMKEKISDYEKKIDFIENELASQNNDIQDFKDKKINYTNEKKQLKELLHKDKIECENIMGKKKKLEIEIQTKISLGEKVNENENVKKDIRNYEKKILKLEGEIKLKKNSIKKVSEEIIKINSIMNKFLEEKEINETNLNTLTEKKKKLEKIYQVQINHLNSLEQNLKKQIQFLKE